MGGGGSGRGLGAAMLKNQGAEEELAKETDKRGGKPGSLRAKQKHSEEESGVYDKCC